MEGGFVWCWVGAGWVGSLYGPLYSRRISGWREGGRERREGGRGGRERKEGGRASKVSVCDNNEVTRQGKATITRTTPFY